MALSCSLSLKECLRSTQRSKTRFRTPKGVLKLAKGLPWPLFGCEQWNSWINPGIIPGGMMINEGKLELSFIGSINYGST
jgi:hypothetical protein